MKVICIDNSAGAVGCAPGLLEEGEIYTASQCSVFPGSYRLEEVAFNPLTGLPISFKKHRFIPLNGPCEVEVLEERQAEEANMLDSNWEAIWGKISQQENA